MKDVNLAKDALEAELIRPLYNACRQYVAALRHTRGALGIQARTAMCQRLEVILARHYARTAAVMMGNKPAPHPSIAEVALSLRHADSLQARAHRQALQIMHGLDRDMRNHSLGMRNKPASMRNNRLPDDHMSIFSAAKEAKVEKAEVLYQWHPADNGDECLKCSMFRAPRSCTHVAGPIDPEGWCKDFEAANAIEGKADDPEAAAIAASAAERTGEPEEATAGYELDLGKDALGRLRRRMATLANVETQAVAEEARWEFVQQSQANTRIMQRWVSLMDGRERQWHHDAHGQVVPVTSAFVVGGQRLRYPGDVSLGATLKNVINCRCSAQYFVTDASGREVTMHVTPHAPAKRQRARGDRPQREGDNRPAYNPTSRVTLNGRTRARVILGNGEVATLRQERPDLVIISRGRQTVGRATIRGGKIGQLTIDPAYRGSADVEGLLRRTIER